MRLAWLPGKANVDTRRRAISVFILLHLVVIASLSIPSNTRLATALRNAVTPYAWRVGLFQAWDMFAPNPIHANAFVSAEITFRGGTVRVWTFPQMQELGYIERYSRERYRKFSNERLSLKSNSVLWPDAARYIARLVADPLNRPQTVKLIHYWSVISPPPEPGQTPLLDGWKSEVLFTYTVNAGDLL